MSTGKKSQYIRHAFSFHRIIRVQSRKSTVLGRKLQSRGFLWGIVSTLYFLRCHQKDLAHFHILFSFSFVDLPCPVSGSPSQCCFHCCWAEILKIILISCSSCGGADKEQGKTLGASFPAVCSFDAVIVAKFPILLHYYHYTCHFPPTKETH